MKTTSEWNGRNLLPEKRVHNNFEPWEKRKGQKFDLGD
jgi:hypothetical protein